MFDKLKLFYGVFRAGQSVANPRALKKAQLAANLTSLLGAVALLGKGFGYDLHLSPEDLVSVAGSLAVVFGLFNAGATVASTDKIGLPAEKPTYPILIEDDQHLVPVRPAPSVPMQSVSETPSSKTHGAGANDIYFG